MRAVCVSEFLKKTTGSMTVEFVVLVPILLAALGFSYEFGRAFWAYDVMTRDVRNAVRYQSRVPYDATFKGYAANVAKNGVPTGGAPHFPWGASSSVVVATVASPDFAPPNYNETGTIFTVTGSVPLTVNLLTFLTPFGINPSYTLTVQDRARWIGN